MRRRHFLWALASAPAAADALDAVQRLYHNELARLGRWEEVPGLGSAWHPDRLPAGWRPFSVGSWRYTVEGGWFWQGALQFSKIAEHRGRWRRVDGLWWWLPGARVEPAPVAWGRIGAEWIAWAPEPGDGRTPEAWSMLRRGDLAKDRPPIEPAAADGRIVSTGPPDPAEMVAAGGPRVQPVSIGTLFDADDLTAWFATGTRSVRGVGELALPRPAPIGTPQPSGPSAPDDAWGAFERRHQDDLRENQRLLERERSRARDYLR